MKKREVAPNRGLQAGQRAADFVWYSRKAGDILKLVFSCVPNDAKILIPTDSGVWGFLPHTKQISDSTQF